MNKRVCATCSRFAYAPAANQNVGVCVMRAASAFRCTGDGTRIAFEPDVERAAGAIVADAARACCPSYERGEGR